MASLGVCVCVCLCVSCSPGVYLPTVTLESETLFVICLGVNFLIAKLDSVSFQILLFDSGHISLVFHSKAMKILHTDTNHFHELCSMESFSFIYHMYWFVYAFIYVFQKCSY